MIQKYLYGDPFDTESVAAHIPPSQGVPPVGTVEINEAGFCFVCRLAQEDRVYGLGEANRGINKRGFAYVSDNVDDGLHTENKQSLYGAHNFLLIAGEKNLGCSLTTPPGSGLTSASPAGTGWRSPASGPTWPSMSSPGTGPWM